MAVKKEKPETPAVVNHTEKHEWAVCVGPTGGVIDVSISNLSASDFSVQLQHRGQRIQFSPEQVPDLIGALRAVYQRYTDIDR